MVSIPIMVYLFFLLLIVFIATLIRSTFGFGESLVAVPLLSFFMPLDIVVPLGVLISITVAGVIMLQDHQKVDIKSAKWLIIFALPGIPLGLLLLLTGTEVLTKCLLGFILLIYSAYSFVKKSAIQQIELKTAQRWLVICGLLSGVLGGAYGLNGPPLVAYGNKRGWDNKQFRATLQAYFLPISLITMLGYGYQGLWTPELGHDYLMTLPVVLPTIFFGRYLNHRIKKGSFLQYIFAGLAIIGLILFFQGLWHF